MDDARPVAPLTKEDLIDVLNARGRKPLSKTATLVSLLVAVASVGTTAVIYVGSVARTEGERAAQAVGEPLNVKLEALDQLDARVVRLDEKVDELSTAVSGATAQLTAVGAQLREFGAKLTESCEQIREMFTGQQRTLNKLYQIEIDQNQMESKLDAHLANP
jgi:hypothetical protein